MLLPINKNINIFSKILPLNSKVTIQSVGNEDFRLFSILNLNSNPHNLELAKENGINLNSFKIYSDPRYFSLGQRMLINLENVKFKFNNSNIL